MVPFQWFPPPLMGKSFGKVDFATVVIPYFLPSKWKRCKRIVIVYVLVSTITNPFFDIRVIVCLCVGSPRRQLTTCVQMQQLS